MRTIPYTREIISNTRDIMWGKILQDSSVEDSPLPTSPLPAVSPPPPLDVSIRKLLPPDCKLEQKSAPESTPDAAAAAVASKSPSFLPTDSDTSLKSPEMQEGARGEDFLGKSSWKGWSDVVAID